MPSAGTLPPQDIVSVRRESSRAAHRNREDPGTSQEPRQQGQAFPNQNSAAHASTRSSDDISCSLRRQESYHLPAPYERGKEHVHNPAVQSSSRQDRHRASSYVHAAPHPPPAWQYCVLSSPDLALRDIPYDQEKVPHLHRRESTALRRRAPAAHESSPRSAFPAYEICVELSHNLHLGHECSDSCIDRP